MHIVLGSYRSFRNYMKSKMLRPQDPEYWWVNDHYKLHGRDRDSVKEVIVLHDADTQAILAAEDRYGKDKLVFVE